jgi:UDP-3-O-acyl-N-acetylglucosamine deacetylase
LAPRRGLGSGVTTSDLLVFGDDGPIDNELRFQDECVRHKTLDLVRDWRSAATISRATSSPTAPAIA